MAAEFWEQGDLERTVLDQQPIVSVVSRTVHLDVWIGVLGSAPDSRKLSVLILISGFFGMTLGNLASCRTEVMKNWTIWVVAH